MKHALFVVPAILAVSVFAQYSFADTESAKPFDALWSAIAALDERIDSLVLTPGPQGEKGEKGDPGEPGPQGPAGEDGADAKHGAGNIAFIAENSRVLTTDGVVYTVFSPHENAGNTLWIPSANLSSSLSNINPPIPVDDIVDWRVDILVDTFGDVWRYQANNTWVNVGHP